MNNIISFLAHLLSSAMSLLAGLNSLVTLGLAVAVMVVGLCRFNSIKIKTVQLRYVLPTICGTTHGIIVFFLTVGADQPDFFTAVPLLGTLVYMLNNRSEWRQGVPLYMMRGTAIIKNERWPGDIIKRLKTENFLALTALATAMMFSTVAAMEGRGEPLQIYKVYADPRVTTSNGDLDIVYTYRRTRPCTGSIDRTIMRAGSEAVAQRFAPTPQATTKIGVTLENVRVHIELDNLAPGNYVYRAIATSYCDDAPAPYIKVLPDVPFIVAPDPLPR